MIMKMKMKIRMMMMMMMMMMMVVVMMMMHDAHLSLDEKSVPALLPRGSGIRQYESATIPNAPMISHATVPNACHKRKASFLMPVSLAIALTTHPARS
jgi:hypothetical protein